MGIFDRVKKIADSFQSESVSAVGAKYGKFVVLDVETTGLNPDSHRIVELALITVVDGAAVEAWSSQFNPEGPVGKTEIHGITDEDVANAPRFKDQVHEISKRIQDVVVVAHNARFDLAFLRSEFDRAGHASQWIPSICTLNASNYYQPHLSRRRLADCCEDAGIEINNAHSAGGDALATAKLFHYYLSSDTEPLPRQEDLDLVRNPSSQFYKPTDNKIKNEFVRERIVRESEQRSHASNQSVYSELTKLLAACSFAEVLEAESFEGEFAYLEKVVEYLEDGVISESEFQELEAVAGIYGLTNAQIAVANRALLRALTLQALKDESISVSERDELSEFASSLNIKKETLSEVIKEAKELRSRTLSKKLNPLPDSWKLGEPLRVGQKVVFTGCNPDKRAELEKESKKLGVGISSNVSKKTSLLVTDGSYVGNKANDAKALGLRVVTPEEYELMLQYLQPALEDSVQETKTESSQIGAEGLDPSEVRKWAISNGIEVAPKGRIHSDVYDKYRKREV